MLGLPICLAALLTPPDAPVGTVAEPFDRLARTRDPKGLALLADPALKQDFAFLTRPGSFGTGSLGWTARSAKTPAGETLVVFSTPLTVQDYGERVFLQRGGKLVEYIDEADSLGYSVTSHDFDVRFAPRTKHVFVTDRIRLNATAKARDFALLRIGPNYRVRSVLADGRAVQWAQAGGVLVTSLPRGQSTALTVEYMGHLDHKGFAGAIANDEAMLTNDYWWFSIGRMPAPYRIKVTAPKGWTVVAQGEEDPGRDNPSLHSETVTTFHMDLPTSYYSLSAGMFRKVSHNRNGVTYSVYSRTASEQTMKTQLALMPPVIEYYSKTYKPYPFTRWGAVITDLYSGGALEAYSYATYDATWLPDEDAHEPAHTWFGGFAPNTYLRSYWNESFASFCDVLYQKETPIGSQSERRSVFRVGGTAPPFYSTLACKDSGANADPDASGIGYGKGSQILQQLELEMGTDQLQSRIAKFVQACPPGQAAEWSDFEMACGDQWAGFFKTWVHEPTFPEPEFTAVTWQSGVLSGQAHYKSKPFPMTIEVWIGDANLGSIQKVTLKPGPDGKAVWSLVCPVKPARVVVDPLDKVMSATPPAAPLTLQDALASANETLDPHHEDWSVGDGSGRNRVLTGHPDTMPALAPYLRQAGFVVRGDNLTYDGTTIDLRAGMAAAVLTQKGGKAVTVKLGKARVGRLGRASLALTDEFGRVLRARPSIRTEGRWVFSP